MILIVELLIIYFIDLFLFIKLLILGHNIVRVPKYESLLLTTMPFDDKLLLLLVNK